MIRKFLFSIFIIYIIAWFTIAYSIKGKVATIISNSETDNIKISYSQMKVGGFPSSFQVILVDPKIKITNHQNYKETYSSHLRFTFDLSLKKALLNLGTNIIHHENFADRLNEYSVKSPKELLAQVKFNRPLYKFSSGDSFKSRVKYIQIKNDSLALHSGDIALFEINDLSFLLNKSKVLDEENLALQARLAYFSKENYSNFKTGRLDISSLMTIVDSSDQGSFIKDLSIDRLSLTCDETSQVDLVGSLQFSKNKLPKGKLSFEVSDYQAVINKLIPSNFILPKWLIKSAIERGVNSSAPELVSADDTGGLPTYTKIKFDIEFSDRGITIGSLNLLELNLQDYNKLADPAQQDSKTLIIKTDSTDTLP